MDKIRMVDLNTQYNKIKPEIDQAMQDVIESSAFINGPHVKSFQEHLANYLNAEYVIPCANGTDALQIALMALELKPGTEVITPDFTFISTVEVIKLLGFKPVLVDVDENTFNISPEGVRNAVTSNTGAIVPVHLFGQCADMKEIMRVAEENNIPVVEDVAQAIGSDFYTGNSSIKAGMIGDIGCTSFFPSKNLGCYGDGGALFTNNEDLASRIKAIANHGSNKKYYHDRVGVNSRLDTLQAAILDVKLTYLDNYNESRQWAASYYDCELEDVRQIRLPERNEYSSHIFHQYTIVLEENVDRNDFKEYLNQKGIPSMVYYPVPIHLQKAFEDLGHSKGDFPVSESLSDSVLSLPMHTELNEEQLEKITETIKSYFK
ncbi:MAG: DegT/DnrJ/EryC1/StrS family aminotransferase [Bacteroidota bacterium]